MIVFNLSKEVDRVDAGKRNSNFEAGNQRAAGRCKAAVGGKRTHLGAAG